MWSLLGLQAIAGAYFRVPTAGLRPHRAMFLQENGRGAISTCQLPGNCETNDAGAYHLRGPRSSTGYFSQTEVWSLTAWVKSACCGTLVEKNLCALIAGFLSARASIASQAIAECE